jgi:branched-chain amino acid aminotransferase
LSGGQDFTPDFRNDSVPALLDGKLAPPHAAQVSMFDAGFGLGETGCGKGCACTRGHCCFSKPISIGSIVARPLRIDIGLSRAEWTASLRELLRANGMEAHGFASANLGISRQRRRQP